MIGPPEIRLERGTLWPRLKDVTGRALASGALLPIATEMITVESEGVCFLVRVLASLGRKEDERKRRNTGIGAQSNPFLPYEEDLFVAEITGSHVALLNKFNVMEHHLLIVTRRFEDQEMLLTLDDFLSLWTCMAEFEALGFYNGGVEAGASQPHKHLQMVPLPIGPGGQLLPVEPLLDHVRGESVVLTVPGFPFRHAFARIDDNLFRHPEQAAEETFLLYARMLKRMNMEMPLRRTPVRQSGPYCLLATRRWMLLVPRSREFFDGISINSLGYAGSFFVKTDEQVMRLKEAGPMNVLRRVAIVR